MPLHHVAYATRDVLATTHFYEDLMGFPLVLTEQHGSCPPGNHCFECAFRILPGSKYIEIAEPDRRETIAASKHFGIKLIDQLGHGIRR